MSPQPINIETLRQPRTLAELLDIGSLELLGINDLKFDHIYQRDLSAPDVQEMAETWDKRVAGVIIVSRRSNGELYVLDGQHRVAAAKTAGETHILALVFDGLTGTDEAALRVKGNKRRVENPQQQFRARLAAGDEVALAIQKLCRDYGTRINSSPQTKAGINAVKIVETIYRRDGGVLLARVFDIVQRAWGDVTGDHAKGDVLRGLAWLLERNNEKLNTNRLVDRLQAEGSDGLRRKADSHRAAHGGSGWINWYRAVVEVYNAKLPEGQRLHWTVTGPGGSGTRAGRR